MVLFMGPIPPPYTGQSVAFASALDGYKRDNSVIVIDISNKKNIISALLLCFKISYYMLFFKIETVYFTCSRSVFGSVRDVVLLFWARLRRRRVVNHLHGADFKGFYENAPILYKKILRWCYNGVDTSIVLFDGMKSQFSDFLDMKKVVVSNSYSKDLDLYPTTKQSQRGKIKILYLSNLMKSKGITYFLQSIERILANHEDVVIDIAGIPIGDYLSSENRIKAEFNELYLKIKTQYPQQIFYHGTVINEDKKKILWESDIFVLPTFYLTEALPISILEAMRSGNYIISTKHNYIPEFISAANGELIAPKSSSAIEEAIDRTIANRNHMNKIQNYNISYAIENFSEEKYVSNVCNILSQ